MYAKYTYNAGALIPEILADYVLLLTGTTDKTLLSASCDQVNTEIFVDAGNGAGWTVWDAAAGTNKVCLRSIVKDSAGTYKYALLDFSSAQYAYLGVYESWNATTHVGTNLTNYSLTNIRAQKHDITNGGKMLISASAAHIHWYSYSDTYGWGSSSDSGSCGLFEHTRNALWDTDANGYQPVVFVPLGFACNSTTGMYSPRRKNAAGGDVTGGACSCNLTTPFRASAATINASLPTTTGVDANNNPVRLFMPWGPTSYSRCDGGGDCAVLSSNYLLARSSGAQDDEIVYDGNTYIVWDVYPAGQVNMAIRKG